MSKKRQLTAPDSVPPLKIASRVTREHGEAFAKKWRQMQSGEIASEAFGRVDLIEWPEEDPNRPLGVFFDARRDRYHDITDEIAEKTFTEVMPAIAEAFVKYARKVLARERRRQAK
jgi:hypothetical protein